MATDAEDTGEGPSCLGLRSILWRNHEPIFEWQYNAFLKKVENSGFDWLIFVIAASGFFTDSYNLFASNVILPAIAYVYWREDHQPDGAISFSLATLAASAVGQLFFGCFADLYGRRALYGVELIIVIVSTVGLLQCSRGYAADGVDGPRTWHITPWLIFWRTIMGFGIGAEYPLSACIAAEWSSTRTRSRMMSAVFLMQPLGQLCAYGAGLTALRIFVTSVDSTPYEIDKLWRYVIGVGTIPTLLALLFRLVMPESGRYTYDLPQATNMATSDVASDVYNDAPVPLPNLPGSRVTQFHWPLLKTYLIDEGNWIYLAGTSITWFLLDFAFYGLGLNGPATLSKVWADRDFCLGGRLPWWLKTSNAFLAESYYNATTPSNATNVTLSSDAADAINIVLEGNIEQAIYTVSIASIVGSIAMIAFIDRYERRRFLTVSFVCLGIGLVVIAASFNALFHTDLHIILIIFWIAVSFGFSFGPNTLTFIIPAEVFPTRYRCTFYGVAAASGKVGALMVQIILYTDNSLAAPNDTRIRWLILSFGFCMLIGAVVSHYMLPMVQRESGGARPPWENIPLEEMEKSSHDTRKSIPLRRRRKKKDVVTEPEHGRVDSLQ